MADNTNGFVIENGVLQKYCGNDSHVVIPEGVRAIGKLAFAGRFHMKSITIPDSVTEIGDEAFWHCSGLESIVIPPGVTKICRQAFGNCYGIKTITIPGGVSEISTGSFWQCSGLESVVIPEGVTRIGSTAFLTCYNLKSIVIPADVKAIGSMAFHNCRALRTVTLPDGLEEIGSGAFADCMCLESIRVPDSLKRIGDGAFKGCKQLKLANKPNCMPEIGKDAFKDSDPHAAAAFLEAEKNNTEMYSGCIVTVTNLRRHTGADSLQCTEINGHNVIVGSSCRIGRRLVYFPIGGQLEETFARENHLLRVDGDDGQTAGYLHPVRRNIAVIRLRGEVSEGLALPIEVLEKYTDIHSLKEEERIRVLDGHRLCRPYIPDEMTLDIKNRILTRYRGKRNTPRKVYIPWGTEIIGSGAFSRSRYITEVILPETVTAIKGRAFYDCPGLKRVVIPDSVRSIGSEAFAHCGSLAADCLPESLKHLEQDIFTAKDFEIRNGRLIRYTGECRDVMIPEGVTEIGKYAFGSNRWIENVTIPMGVTKIEYRAFADCRRLRSVSLPDGVKEIGDHAFLNCGSLHEITLPPGVEHIGRHAFGEYCFSRYERGFKFPNEIYRKYRGFRMNR